MTLAQRKHNVFVEGIIKFTISPAFDQKIK